MLYYCDFQVLTEHVDVDEMQLLCHLLLYKCLPTIENTMTASQDLEVYYKNDEVY
jgi:hypothetical protein